MRLGAQVAHEAVSPTTTVTIQGRVSTFYLKHLAQETILPLLEGRGLCNRVQVVPDALPADF